MTGRRRHRRRRSFPGALVAGVVAALVIGVSMLVVHPTPLAQGPVAGSDAVDDVGSGSHGIGSAAGGDEDRQSILGERQGRSFARPIAPSPGAGHDGQPPDQGGGQDGACGAFPQFPDESCTGWRHTGVTLRECSSTVSEPGAELDGCRFVGGLRIDAPDVTVTRSRIEGMVQPRGDLQNLSLVDVEIDGTDRVDPHGSDSQLAIGSSNYTCIRCHIHNTGRGANLGRNVHIEASYLHDFPYMNGQHLTAIGSNGGSNLTLIHNNLECGVGGCSAALSLYGDFAPIEDVLVQHNLFNTTGSYCTYAGSVSGKAYPVGNNIRYIDNRFGKKFSDDCGQFGPVTSWRSGSGNEWRGNQWQDDGGPVTP